MIRANALKKLPLRIFLWIFFLISAYPFLYLVCYSLKSHDEIFYTNPFGPPIVYRFENYLKAVNAFNILLFFKNSVIVTFVSCSLATVLALAFAYSVARTEWRFSSAAYKYMLLGIFIPIQVTMIPLAVLNRDLRLSGSYLSLILPYIAFNLSFSILIFYGFFRTIPKEMEESAYIDGAGYLRTFASIMAPLVKPAIGTALIFAFLNIWNEYSMALVLLSNLRLRTLPVGLATSFAGSFQTDWGPMGAAMVITCIPAIVIYAFLSEHVEKALTVGAAVKG
jgi:raffinose/stachyose/melibiose transport system permease protein